MQIANQWIWNSADQSVWLQPCQEVYYIASRWKNKGFRSILDYGCGLGRNTMVFAQHAFEVSAFDASEDAVQFLKERFQRENLIATIDNTDMCELPYDSNIFNGIFAYHVVSHTTSSQIKDILDDIYRILMPDGELYITFCSKSDQYYQQANKNKLDLNTIIKIEDGPEKGVPHFYVSLDEVFTLLNKFSIHNIHHVIENYYADKLQNSAHYHVLCSKKVSYP